MTDSPILQASGLAKTYGAADLPVQALRDVDLSLDRGEFVALMGPSGCGKSTLLHLLGGLDRPTGGEVWLSGQRVDTLSEAKWAVLRRAHIGFVFQFFNLLPMLTAEENITLPLSIAGEKPDREFFDDLIGKVGLANRLTHRPAELSGGQQQRVAIARALVSRPTVLFADEPTGNLDSTTSAGILDLLRDSADTYGQTMVIVTHDARAAAIADRVLFLADGLIVKDMPRSSQGDILTAISELTPDLSPASGVAGDVREA